MVKKSLIKLKEIHRKGSSQKKKPLKIKIMLIKFLKKLNKSRMSKLKTQLKLKNRILMKKKTLKMANNNLFKIKMNIWPKIRLHLIILLIIR